MIRTFEHAELGSIVYEESLLSGKKSLTINGEKLQKTDKTHYSYKLDGECIEIELKGNSMLGVTLSVKDKKIQIVDAPAWYVTAFAALSFAFIIIWGSSVALCKIFPVIGGAAGGAISAIFAISSVFVASKIKNSCLKLLSSIGFCALTILICHLIAKIILSAL